MFNAHKLPFHTEIEAEYLIAGASPDIVFLFTDANTDDGHYFPRSIFVQDIRDYTINQTPIYLLKETRITRSTGKEKLIFRKPDFTE